MLPHQLGRNNPSCRRQQHKKKRKKNSGGALSKLLALSQRTLNVKNVCKRNFDFQQTNSSDN